MKYIAIFAILLYSVKAEYLPTLTTDLQKFPHDNLNYVLSKPRAIPTPSLVRIPHSNLQSYVADLPLRQRLFTPAGSDPIQSAGSDQVLYAAAPNSVFHTQINVQSQGSEFNAPNSEPIVVDPEESRSHRKPTYENNRNYDYQRSQQDYRSYPLTKSPYTSRHDHFHSTQDNRSYKNGRDGKDGHQNYDTIHKTEDHRSYHDERKSYDRTDGKIYQEDQNLNQRKEDKRTFNSQNLAYKSNDHQNLNNDRRTYDGHDGQDGRDGRDGRDGKKSYDNHDSYYKTEHQQNFKNEPKYYDGQDGEKGNDAVRKTVDHKSPYDYDKYLERKNNGKRTYDGQRGQNGKNGQNAYNAYDKIREELVYAHDGQPGQKGRNQGHNHDHSRTLKRNSHSRIENRKKQPNFQGVNLINGDIAANQATLLPLPTENLNGNTQGINIINGNILGGRKQSRQCRDVKIHQQRTHKSHTEYKASDRSVMPSTAIKIIALNNNNNTPKFPEIQTPNSARTTSFELNPSASAPEVIYKSGDEIDFAETKLIDYADNRRPLESYKFDGRRGPQRKKQTVSTRSEAKISQDGYHYKEPSKSFNS